MATAMGIFLRSQDSRRVWSSPAAPNKFSARAVRASAMPPKSLRLIASILYLIPRLMGDVEPRGCLYKHFRETVEGPPRYRVFSLSQWAYGPQECDENQSTDGPDNPSVSAGTGAGETVPA